MTILFFNLSKFCNIHLCLSTMDKRGQSAVKGNPSGSISLNHDLLDVQSDWSRCNSFSSSSNDSSVFCNNRHQTSPLTVGKRLRSDRPATRLSKRSRNSSGSSVSSSMSCVSDKDTKKTPVIISSNCVPQVPVSQSGIRTNVESLSRLSCSDIHPSKFKLNHEALLNQHLSCSDTAGAIIPFRHNLRRNIRKKTCSCDCTATCTTLVVRRYNKVGKKTVEEETVISTKVQTCSPNKSTQEIHNVSYEKSFSPSKADSNRRRRSEIEKLYDSLHEIEWAKNFSPDNILRQINVRQAASVSMFGNQSKCKMGSVDTRMTRRHRDSTDLVSCSPIKATSPKSPIESKKLKPDCLDRGLSPRTRSKTRSSLNNIVPSSADGANKSPVKNKSSSSNLSAVKNNCQKICSKDYCLHEPEFRSDCSTSSVTCSVDDLADSGFGHSVSTGSLELLESPILKAEDYIIDFQNDSKEDISIPDITSDIAFFNIAEEGIRTIDACFREVGAEVVISTCYDGDFDLPRLTSAKDNNMPDKFLAPDDIPPVLERCVNIQEKVCSQVLECNIIPDLARKCAYERKKCSNRLDRNSTTETSTKVISNNNQRTNNSKKMFSINKSVNRTLILLAGRRILNKYLKYLHSKAKLKGTSSTDKPVEEIKNKQNLRVENHRLSNSNVAHNENKSLIKSSVPASGMPASSSFAFKSHKLLCQTVGENSEAATMLKTSNQDVSSCGATNVISFSHSKSNSYLYDPEKQKNSSVSRTENENKTLLIHENSASTLTPKVTSAMKNEVKNEVTPTLHIPFTCYYRTLVVTKSQGYAQVILKFTRKKSIFLTLEALEELKDLINRVGQDPKCHTFILNGIDDSFCSGLDLKPLLGPQKIKNSNEMAVAVKEFIEALSAFKKPFVAVVNGPAIGLGLTILTHADISIASDKATFCMPQTKLGYFPEGGATLTLPQAVGSTTAMDLILRSRSLTAREAKDIGLVSEVVEAKNLSQDLVSRVKRLAENSITCMETTKAMLKTRLHVELIPVLENEVKLLPQMWLSHSCQEALQRALDSGLWID